MKKILLIFILLGTVTSLLLAREVEVKEVDLTLHNKPVSGFRMIIDRSSKTVLRSIIAANEDYNTKPFHFEQTLIYENIRYAPVTSSRDISLYYIMRGLPGQMTELTIVGMYDYKRSINSREFPELSKGMLGEIGKLVRNISGDAISFKGELFEQPEVTRQHNEEATYASTMEHYKEEEVENSSVYLKQNPFELSRGGGIVQDSVMKVLVSQLNELQRKEGVWRKKEQELRSRIQSYEQQKQIQDAKMQKYKVFADSIARLNQRIAMLQYPEYAGDPVSLTAEDAKILEELGDKYTEVSRKYTDLIMEADSLTMTTAGLGNLLRDKERQNERLKRLLEDSRKREDELKLQLAAGNSGTSEPIGADALSKLQSENSDLKTQLERETANRKEVAGKLESSQMENKRLRLEVEKAEVLRESLKNSLREKEEALAFYEKPANRDMNNMKWQIDALKKENSGLQEKLREQLALNKERFVLMDSIKKLHQQMNAGIQPSEVTALRKQISDKDRELKNTRDQLALVKQERDRYKAKASSPSSGSSDLTAELQLAKQRAKNLDEKVQTLTAQREKDKSEIESLKLKLTQAKARAVPPDNKALMLETRVATLEKENEQLNERVRGKENQLLSFKQLTDSLSGDIVELRRDIVRGEQLNRNWKTRFDSLLVVAQRPLTANEQFVREQMLKLEQDRQKLEEREEKIANEEKLLAQKNAYLGNREAELNAREKKYSDLERREDQLKMLETQIRQNKTAEEVLDAMFGAYPELENNSGSGGSASYTVSSSETTELGARIPVINISTDLTMKKAQKAMIGYMLDQGNFYNEIYPDLIYESARIKEIGQGSLMVKVRFSPAGVGTKIGLSFLKPNGQYLNPTMVPDLEQRVESFTRAMINY